MPVLSTLVQPSTGYLKIKTSVVSTLFCDFFIRPNEKFRRLGIEESQKDGDVKVSWCLLLPPKHTCWRLLINIKLEDNLLQFWIFLS